MFGLTSGHPATVPTFDLEGNSLSSRPPVFALFPARPPRCIIHTIRLSYGFAAVTDDVFLGIRLPLLLPFQGLGSPCSPESLLAATFRSLSAVSFLVMTSLTNTEKASHLSLDSTNSLGVFASDRSEHIVRRSRSLSSSQAGHPVLQ